MIKTLESIVSQLTNDELRKAFDELIEFKNTGVLVRDGIVRAVHADFEEFNDTSFPIGSVDKFIFFEISKRAYSLLPSDH
ncbi:Pseudouridine synthase [Brevibacillus sp. IT-7CA2]|uniref:hypothetical protein n=1 Tax=Brevibacillus sp. IT-7CA2 TaxID=3026436 RepID=UPI0039E0DDBE